MSVADIVPIALGLPAGDFVTLWAPSWREDGELWEGLLGLEDDLYGFSGPAELGAFIRSGAPNDLDDHPSWEYTAKSSIIEFDPDDDHSYDLVGVPELLAENPTEDSVLELDDCFNMVRTIGSICDLAEIEKFFQKHGELGATSGGVDNFYGREGQRAWNRIGKIVAKDWDDVLELIDSLISTPDVDETLLSAATAELVEARELLEGQEDDTAGLLDTDEWEPDPDEDPFWAGIGIDPVKIIFPRGSRFTLRCYINDEPLFLGDGSKIYGFTSQRALVRFLASEPDHSMYSLPSWNQVEFRANSGDLNVRPTEDNIYSFQRLPKQFKEGPAAVDYHQLDMAVEVLSDAADYLGDSTVDEALDVNTRLGAYVDTILGDDDDLPEGPYDDTIEEWEKLVEWLDEQIEKK